MKDENFGWTYIKGRGDVYGWPEGQPAGRGADGILPEIFSSPTRMAEHLRRYFGVSDKGTPRYSGSHFEWFVARARSSHAYDVKRPRFNESHILAAESLSIQVPVLAVRRLLEPDGERDSLLDKCGELLSNETDNMDLCPGAWISVKSPFSMLHNALRDMQIDEFGRVTRSKVVAAIFPEVVPIRDSFVETLLGLENSEAWWMPIREILEANDSAVLGCVKNIDVPERAKALAILRRLDVILWMEERAIRFPLC